MAAGAFAGAAFFAGASFFGGASVSPASSADSSHIGALAAGALAAFTGFNTPLAKASSRYASASSGVTFNAGAISEIRLTRARSYMVRSAADNDASRLREARFRTTSATWYTSPLFNFSWWFLNRRLQFDGTRGSALANTATRSSSSSGDTGGRTPTSSTLAMGTMRRISPITASRIR